MPRSSSSACTTPVVKPMATQTKIRIPNNWRPRRYQRNVWRYLEQDGKRAVCIWHRRAGKDEVCLHWAASSMIDKPATYWHMLPKRCRHSV